MGQKACGGLRVVPLRHSLSQRLTCEHVGVTRAADSGAAAWYCRARRSVNDGWSHDRDILAPPRHDQSSVAQAPAPVAYLVVQVGDPVLEAAHRALFRWTRSGTREISTGRPPSPRHRTG